MFRHYLFVIEHFVLHRYNADGEVKSTTNKSKFVS